MAGRPEDDQQPGPGDRTFADQTHADTEQTAADRDQEASDRDQEASDRDQEASDRDLVLTGNVGLHEATRELRERSTEARRRSTEQRLIAASARDAAAEARDAAAEQRDAAADARDRELVAQEAPVDDEVAPGPADFPAIAAAYRARAVAARAAAAEARARAAADRSQAARDREQAARDRARAADDRRNLLRQLEAANTDVLTGARVRAAGLVDLEHEIDRARRGNGLLTVAYIDVIGLKPVNDTQGHAAGDALLQGVVRTVRSSLRSYDLIVRLGGDEFLSAMADIGADEARRRLATIRRELASAPQPCAIRTGFAQLTASDTAATLIERADTDLLADSGG